jgi:hypothetical protein
VVVRQHDGFRTTVAVSSNAAQFLGPCDGRAAIGEILSAWAEATGAGPEDVEGALDACRVLVEEGMLLLTSP